jgi:parallel beta-helix repeat protein
MISMRREMLAGLLVLVVASSAVVGYMIFGMPGSARVGVRYPLSQHSPINIATDSDFTKPGAGSGCECVRSGSGQRQDPYIISDWTVNSTEEAIHIWRTSAYFVISRVDMHGVSSGHGIFLDEVQNGVFESCQIIEFWFGVYVFRSAELEFTNNTVTGAQFAILLEASNDNKLVANRFDDNREIGIFVRGSRNLLKENSVRRNGFGGINVDGTAGAADGNQIIGNIVSDSGQYGIGMWRATNNVVRSNTIMRNTGVGITLTDHSTNNLIEANTISGSIGNGISLVQGSSGNTIRGNTAKGNGDGVNCYDLLDYGSNNVWQNNTYDTKKPDTID